MRLHAAAGLLLALVAWPGAAAELVLANGDTITGEIVEWAVDHVVIQHPQLGRVRLTLDQLRLDPGEPPNPGLFGTGFLRGWKRRIDLGANGERGGSLTNLITAGLDLAYDDGWTRWAINGRYLFEEADEEDDDSNNGRLDVRRDWLDPGSRWFRRLAARYQYDGFESWRHRLTALAGPGYHLIDTTSHQLDVAAGPGFIREFAGSRDNRGLAVLSVDYRWAISEFMDLEATNNVFYELAPDTGDIQNFTRLTWSTKISRRRGLSLNVTLENEYESDPDPGDEANDLKYFLTLGLDL